MQQSHWHEGDSSKIAPNNVVDINGACAILKEMIMWSMRLSDSIDDLHNFLHGKEHEEHSSQDLLKRVLYCKDKLALMWGVPFPVTEDQYELVAQSTSTTLS